MLRRLFLVVLPSLTTSVSYANEASWNCVQNKDSKEWVCVGEKKQTAKTSESAHPVKPEPVKEVQPALAEPVENKQPVLAESVKPGPAEKVQAVIAEPIQVSEPVESIPSVNQEPARTTPSVTAKSIESIQPAKSASVQGAQPTLPASQKLAVESNKLPGEKANRPGWNCEANKGDENWNCQLVGPSPESKTQIVATEEPMIRLLTPAFDHQEEQTFSTLTSQLKYDPWENCPMERGTKRDFVPAADQRNVSPMDVKSNYAEVFDNEIGSYSGNVKMARADQHASANTANYDSVSEVLDLHGNVYYSEEQLALYSDSATLNLASDQAKLRDVQFIAATAPLRGRAKAYYRDSKIFSRYKDVAYTSCRPGNQDWIIHASELKMNKTTGKGAVKNAWVEFKGAPVFYSPYLSFPIDNRRVSGFLAPTFGSTKNSGFRFSAPYYWNIAPNYDATFIPRELTKRGPLLAGKFRYLTEQSNGMVGAEYMPHDQILNKARYLGLIKNNTQFTPNIHSNLDLNYVSDKSYFGNLGNALSFANYNYLKSTADINYANRGVSFSTRAENYQLITTNPTITDASLPYRKLPQVNLNLDHSFKFMPLYTAMENEYIFFQHSPVNSQGINIKPSGQRINTKPSVSVPLQTASSFFTPKLSLQHTQYFLNSVQPGTPNSSISRTLPIFSADSGLFFERDLDIANTRYLHTLEPRLFYLYIPYTNQQDIPVFDSALYDFNYYTMFRENSFSGTDRIQDANQVTAALTSRLVDDKAGLERLKLSVGEIFYFRDRNVTLQYGSTPADAARAALQGSVIQTNSFSNLVTELSSELTHQLSFTSGLQWNPQLNNIQRVNAALHFGNKANELFNIGYIYRKNPLLPNRSGDITQSDISLRLPIYDNWYAMGRWQYSWLYNKTQDAFIGVEKENCCWRFRLAGRHYINNITNVNNPFATTNQTITGTAQTGIFFEIELKGLTSIGDNMDRFLQKEIYGYRKTQNDY